MYSCSSKEDSGSHADKKVDVNILIVPQSQWKADLRHAHLCTCTLSISAGFVRVCPDVTLVDLKDEVSKQLDSNLLPESYIFLRNVGHRLTSVGTKQESVLKVRLFLPPIAPCPEIYVLDSSCLHSNPELPPVKNVNKSSIENCSCNRNRHCTGHCSNRVYHGTGCNFPVHNDAHSCFQNSINYSATPGFSQSENSTIKRYHSDNTPASSSHNSKPSKFRRTAKTYPQGNGSSQDVIDHLNGTHTMASSNSKPTIANGLSNTHTGSNSGLKIHVTGSATETSKTDNSGELEHSEQNSNSTQNVSQGIANQQSAPRLTKQEEVCSVSKNQSTGSEQNNEVGSSNTTRTNTTETELSTTHNHSQLDSSYAENNHISSSSRNQLQPEQDSMAIASCSQAAPKGSYNSNDEADLDVSDIRELSSDKNDSQSPESDLRRSAQKAGKQGGIEHCQINSPSDPGISTERRMAEQKKRKDTYPLIGLNHKSGDSTEKRMAEQRKRKDTYPLVDLNHKSGEQDGKKEIKHGQITSPSGSDISTERRMAEQRERKDTYPLIDLKYKQPKVAIIQTISEPNQTQQTLSLVNQSERTNIKPQDTRDLKLASVLPLPMITVTGSKEICVKDNDDSPSDPGSNGSQIAEEGERNDTYPPIALNQEAGEQGEKQGIKHGQINSRSDPDISTEITMAEQKERKNTYPSIASKHKPPKVVTRKIIDEPNRTKKSEKTKIKPKFDTGNLKLASVPPPLPAITVTERKNVGNIDLLFLTKYKGATEAGSATAASEKKPRPSTAETNDILGEIRRMKEESEELLSLKAKLSSALRSIQTVVRTHRETNDNEWKIKYFQEKKMFTFLQEKIHKARNGNQRITNELEAKKHTRAVQKVTHNTKVEPPSALSNVKIQCKRRKRDIEHLSSKLDGVRLQLSAERKIRESTVDECKTLRSELAKKRITNSRKKNQKTT